MQVRDLRTELDNHCNNGEDEVCIVKLHHTKREYAITNILGNEGKVFLYIKEKEKE